MIERPLRVGTAGWSVPSRYTAEVPTGGSHLERYARRLNAVEINSSFYRPHQRKTYERWAQSTPDNFRFSVKMPKTMTHERGLKECGALLDAFLAEAGGLGDKLAVFLVQLPPKFEFDAAVAGAFFHDLRMRFDAAVAIEPRNASWFTPAVDMWLAECRVARVAADPARTHEAGTPGGWDKLVYYRWHGSTPIYYSDYDATALEALKKRLDQARAGGVETWCIFDNTASGAALGNAMTLAPLV